MTDMIDYIDGHYAENLRELEETASLINFIKMPSVLSFRYDVAFLMMVEDQDAELTETIEFVLASEPLLTLVPNGASDSDGSGEGEPVA